MTKLRIAAAAALLFLTTPLFADPAVPPMPAPLAGAAAALDGLKGKRDILFVTTKGGTQMLGRILSGDHGQYTMQTFHYVTAPAAAPKMPAPTVPPQTTAPAYPAAPAYRRGQDGRLRPVPNRTTPQAPERTTPPVPTQNIVPDAAALRALVSGAAGPSFQPAEQAAGRELVSATEVQTVQSLLPPTSAPGQTRWTLKNVWPAP